MAAALCIDLGVSGILLDELATRANFVTHEHGDDSVSLSGVLDRYLLEHTALGIHGGLPELLVGHLTQTFVSLGLDLLLVAVTVLDDEIVTLLIVPAVLLR